MIENNEHLKEGADYFVKEYVDALLAKAPAIDAILLACTHYPLIKKEINDFYKGQMKILDSSEIVAHALKIYLEKEGLLNSQPSPNHQFLVSDYTESFEAAARMFFHQAVQLEKYPLLKQKVEESSSNVMPD